MVQIPAPLYMVILPKAAVVEEALQSFAVIDQSDVPAFHEVTVELETVRPIQVVRLYR